VLEITAAILEEASILRVRITPRQDATEVAAELRRHFEALP